MSILTTCLVESSITSLPASLYCPKLRVMVDPNRYGSIIDTEGSCIKKGHTCFYSHGTHIYSHRTTCGNSNRAVSTVLEWPLVSTLIEVRQNSAHSSSGLELRGRDSKRQLLVKIGVLKGKIFLQLRKKNKYIYIYR